MKVLKPLRAVMSAVRHRLVDPFGIGPLETRITRGREPILTIFPNSSVVMPAWVTAMSSTNPFSPACRQRLHVAVEHRRERLLGLPLRMHRREDFYAVEREGQLHIHRLLDPERAVIVKVAMRCRPVRRKARLRRDASRQSRVIEALVAPSFQDGNGSPAPVPPLTERSRRSTEHRQRREQDSALDNGKLRSVSCQSVGALGLAQCCGAVITWRDRYLAIAALAASIFAFTASRLKLAPFCIGGNSIAVIASFSTCC